MVNDLMYHLPTSQHVLNKFYINSTLHPVFEQLNSRPVQSFSVILVAFSHTNIRFLWKYGKTWWLWSPVLYCSNDFEHVLRNQNCGTGISNSTHITNGDWSRVCFVCFWGDLIFFCVGFCCGIYDAVNSKTFGVENLSLA